MSYLNTPLENSKLKLKNRLVRPPIAMYKAENDGRVGPTLLGYYNKKQKGGTPLS